MTPCTALSSRLWNQPHCSRAHLHEGLCDALDGALGAVPVLVNKVAEVGLQPV